MDINILYEDEEVIVCEKPAGVAAQTRRLGQADMESLLKNYRAARVSRLISVWYTDRSACAWRHGFCKDERGCGRFEPSGTDKNGR